MNPTEQCDGCGKIKSLYYYKGQNLCPKCMRMKAEWIVAKEYPEHKGEEFNNMVERVLETMFEYER